MSILLKVTADIHLLHASSYQLLLGVFSLANIWKASWGFSSYWLTLVICEAIKFTFVLFISVANVSACLQVAIMFNFRWIWLRQLSWHFLRWLCSQFCYQIWGYKNYLCMQNSDCFHHDTFAVWIHLGKICVVCYLYRYKHALQRVFRGCSNRRNSRVMMRSSRLFSEFYESCLDMEAFKNLNLCHDCPKIISLF